MRAEYYLMYSKRGRVSHAVLVGWRDTGANSTGGDAWCGQSVWLGTGNQDEYEKARSMPLCKRCAVKMEET